MLRFSSFIREEEDHGISEIPWNPNPKIGWWKDGETMTMYHGTHQSRVGQIAKSGLKAPESGPTAGWVSMTHDPHTAHGYASMTGGESAFRAAGSKARTVPHHERVVLVHEIPRDWAEKNMNPHMRGNMESSRGKLTDKSQYDSHSAAGKPDHEYYQTSELRFKDSIPREFLKGYMRRPVKDKGGI